MSCCPKAPDIKQGDSSDSDGYSVTETEMNEGETTECYLKRAANPTGLHDDATDYPKNKIKTPDIPLTGGDTARTTFTLTPDSTKTATEWTFVAKDTPLPSQVTFTSNGSTASLMGTFPKESYGKKFKFELTAKAGSEVLDVKGYVFSPAKANVSNEIRFVHPLPGGICNSPFAAERISPLDGVKKPHWGADFKMKDRSVVDVVAAADGEVVFAGFQPKPGAGNYIKIKHNNAGGKHLCTTVYMHLSSMYVAEGQKVVAGQKIGKEGSTGGSTGNHLHFECRLPDGKRVDPVPYIRGTVEVAGKTDVANNPIEGSVEPRSDNAALTPENVDARQDACEPFGDTYPKRKASDPPVRDLPTPPTGDPFEKAWFYTMVNEVSPAWTQSAPSDPEIAAGLITTPAQRKKVGYVKLAGDTGGQTKFGISQNNNPTVKVQEMDYETARKIGYSNYWKANGIDQIASAKPKTAVMMFDISFLCGGGGGRSVKAAANIDGLSDEASCDALALAWKARLRKGNPKFHAGWMDRVNRTLAYAKSI